MFSSKSSATHHGGVTPPSCCPSPEELDLPALMELSPQFSSVEFSRSKSSRLTLCDSMNAACQASLSIINSWSLPKLMSTESVMSSNHLILCHHLLLLPSIFPSIRVFSNQSALCITWPKYGIYSLARDRTWASCTGSTVLATGPPGKSQHTFNLGNFA